MSNEGESFYYFPAINKLATTEEEAAAIWKQISNTKRYLEFGYLGDVFDDNKVNQVLEVKYDSGAGKSIKRDLSIKLTRYWR
ncbi:MAG: hypothetical protein EOO89_04885 [Pedobacter sp.]|nr:MAG: hypothetical protein EOO89_04885 [Pedobacter sp.]